MEGRKERQNRQKKNKKKEVKRETGCFGQMRGTVGGEEKI